jgi:hypothetical protein
MESATLGVIFVGVWLGIVLLYCLFKVCGGRLVDIISCDCFSGPCCDCWGAGGTIDRYDREYPFHDQGMYLDPYGPYSRPQPQLPPIVVVNSMKDKESRRREEEDGYTSSDDEDYRPRTKRTSRDPEMREEAGGALLLRSSEMNTAPGRMNEPVIV